MVRLLPLLLLVSCDDYVYLPPAHDGGGTVDGDGYCAARSVFEARCTSCHGSGAAGGLDLATDAHAALVDVPSAQFDGVVRVVPGDPDRSLLYLKITGAQGELGGSMPPSGALDEASIAAIRDWIADGASSDCSSGPDTSGSARFHSDDWMSYVGAEMKHGLVAKLQQLDEVDGYACVDCHGATLDGDVGPSCDQGCHLPEQAPDAWRTTCTFCHGDAEAGLPAPPQDVDGNTDAATISFPPHRAHVSGTLHADWDCTQCHTKPTSVLSVGHVFVDDSTAGRAELAFAAGLSVAGSYDGNGTCSNLYCHGDGRSTASGTVHVADSIGCDSCHADTSSGEAGWDTMSGRHDDHLADHGLVCSDCHGATVSDGQQMTNPANHVNGVKDLQLPSGFVASAGDCTGSCHGHFHDDRSW